MPNQSDTFLNSFDDYEITPHGVKAAAARLKGHAVITPLIENKYLNERTGGRIFLKAEIFQHTGSFKYRGAYNRLCHLTEEERKRGVLAWSSGNHAQGVALAAHQFGVRAVILMPVDAPAVKIAAVRNYGAEIVTYDRYSEDREVIGKPLAEKHGYAITPSYDHPMIIEGQGTVALEAVEQASHAGVQLDEFIICCGGGGLTAGCATILNEISPQTQITIAEPENFDETWRSIDTGTRHHCDIKQASICDAIATPTPGKLTLPIMSKLVSNGVTLTEEEVCQAIVFAHKYLKLILEPGGAVALAAILSGKVPTQGKSIAITLSGGNIDISLFCEILQKHS